MSSQSLSRSFKHIALWVFVVLLSISFIAFFVYDGTQSGNLPQSVVGSVDKHKIVNSRSSLFQYFYRRLYDYYTRGQTRVPAGLNESVMRISFNEAVNHHLILQEADKMGIYISSEDLVNGIRGVFGEEEFNNILNSTDPGLRKQIETNVGYTLRADKVRRTLFYHVPVTSREKALYREGSAVQKQIFVATMDLSDRVTARSEEDSSLYDYYRENLDRYYTNTNANDATSEVDSGVDSDISAPTAATANDGENVKPLAVPDAETESDTVSLAASPDEADIEATFDRVKSRVRSDFLIERGGTLAEEERESFEAELNGVLSDVRASTAPRNVFERELQAIGMEFEVSDYFSYFDEEIPVVTSTDGTIAIPASLQRDIFITAGDESIFTYTDDIEDLIYAVLVVDSTTPKSTSVNASVGETGGVATADGISASTEEDEPSFVARRYEERIENQAASRWTQAYYHYLRSFTDIVYRGNPI